MARPVILLNNLDHNLIQFNHVFTSSKDKAVENKPVFYSPKELLDISISMAKAVCIQDNDKKQQLLQDIEKDVRQKKETIRSPKEKIIKEITEFYSVIPNLLQINFDSYQTDVRQINSYSYQTDVHEIILTLAPEVSTLLNQFILQVKEIAERMYSLPFVMTCYDELSQKYKCNLQNNISIPSPSHGEKGKCIISVYLVKSPTYTRISLQVMKIKFI